MIVSSVCGVFIPPSHVRFSLWGVHILLESSHTTYRGVLMDLSVRSKKIRQWYFYSIITEVWSCCSVVPEAQLEVSNLSFLRCRVSELRTFFVSFMMTQENHTQHAVGMLWWWCSRTRWVSANMKVKGNLSAQRASEKWIWIGYPNTITPDYKKQKVEWRIGKKASNSIRGKSLE